MTAQLTKHNRLSTAIALIARPGIGPITEEKFLNLNFCLGFSVFVRGLWFSMQNSASPFISPSNRKSRSRRSIPPNYGPFIGFRRLRYERLGIISRRTISAASCTAADQRSELSAAAVGPEYAPFSRHSSPAELRAPEERTAAPCTEHVFIYNFSKVRRGETEKLELHLKFYKSTSWCAFVN